MFEYCPPGETTFTKGPRARTVTRAPGRPDGRGLVDEIAAYLRAQPAEPDVVASPGAGRPPRVRVLLPYSGSETAERTLRTMIDLAPVLLSEVRVLHVREYDLCRAGRFFVRPQAEALALTHDAVARLRRRGVAATGIVRSATRADVARAIVAEANDSHVSMILIGARRRRSVADLLRHNVVRQVLRLANCPVLVVRTDRSQEVSPPRADTHRAPPDEHRRPAA